MVAWNARALKAAGDRDLRRGCSIFSTVTPEEWSAASAKATSYGWTTPFDSFEGYEKCVVCGCLSSWASPSGEWIHPFCFFEKPRAAQLVKELKRDEKRRADSKKAARALEEKLDALGRGDFDGEPF